MTKAHENAEGHQVVHDWIRENREKERQEASFEQQKKSEVKLTPLENFLSDWKKQLKSRSY
ncbi:hypothetical protein GT360_06495 [Vibrio astriarenae]|uniref:Uncharacterized protein n=1 Tax=Vibrio astriarenae TaxID=1481923 RepID=A0A7Z2YDI3_9VIBR|nr:hypothetical protein [Vibrio astriarenae]QIA63184.1 hypothetical protein GT360_06495 [Vibrio astriarenae]